MSPQTGLRRYRHTHLKWFMGTLVISTLHCRDLIFYFFLRVHKKRKKANKLLFSTQMFSKRIFNFCLLICVLCFCLVAFLCFWCFLVLWCFLWFRMLFGAAGGTKSFRKTIIKNLKLPS